MGHRHKGQPNPVGRGAVTVCVYINNPPQEKKKGMLLDFCRTCVRKETRQTKQENKLKKK